MSTPTLERNVSVIVSTFNGAHKIPIIMNALQKQTFTAFELVIVVDGSTDNTLEIIDRHRNNFANPVKVIHQTNQGRSSVRNRGAEEAASDILVFYDDDMEPSPDSLALHIALQRKNACVIGGNQQDLNGPLESDLQHYKAQLTSKWLAKYQQGVTALTQSNLFFSAANCSIHKNIFKSLQGFDVKLTDAEDYDFAWRAIEHGFPVFFDKTNDAIHHDRIKLKTYIKRLRQYSKANARLKELYPDRYQSIRKISKLKKFGYKLFTVRFVIPLLESNLFKILVPEKVRYKFYDLTTQAWAIEFPDKPL